MSGWQAGIIVSSVAVGYGLERCYRGGRRFPALLVGYFCRASKMRDDLLGIIDQISRQRDLSREVLIDAIEKALLHAVRKRYGSHRQVTVNFDRDTGELKVISPKKSGGNND